MGNSSSRQVNPQSSLQISSAIPNKSEGVKGKDSFTGKTVKLGDICLVMFDKIIKIDQAYIERMKNSLKSKFGVNVEMLTKFDEAFQKCVGIYEEFEFVPFRNWGCYYSLDNIEFFDQFVYYKYAYFESYHQIPLSCESFDSFREQMNKAGKNIKPAFLYVLSDDCEENFVKYYHTKLVTYLSLECKIIQPLSYSVPAHLTSANDGVLAFVLKPFFFLPFRVVKENE